jgi:hypothetical protein
MSWWQTIKSWFSRPNILYKCYLCDEPYTKARGLSDQCQIRSSDGDHTVDICHQCAERLQYLLDHRNEVVGKDDTV